jgi:hypothetical protein
MIIDEDDVVGVFLGVPQAAEAIRRGIDMVALERQQRRQEITGDGIVLNKKDVDLHGDSVIGDRDVLAYNR